MAPSCGRHAGRARPPRPRPRRLPVPVPATPEPLGRDPSELAVSPTSPRHVPAPGNPRPLLCRSGHAASAAPPASSPPDYTMAWAEYYRQQVAFYGQTLGQAQAHSQVRRRPAGLAPSPFPRSPGVRLATATPAPSSPRRERVWAKRGRDWLGSPWEEGASHPVPSGTQLPQLSGSVPRRRTRGGLGVTVGTVGVTVLEEGGVASPSPSAPASGKGGWQEGESAASAGPTGQGARPSSRVETRSALVRSEARNRCLINVGNVARSSHRAFFR